MKPRELREIECSIRSVVRAQANGLFRLALKAIVRGCSDDLVREIRDEAWEFDHMSIFGNYDRMFEKKWKYAFRCC